MAAYLGVHPPAAESSTLVPLCATTAGQSAGLQSLQGLHGDHQHTHKHRSKMLHPIPLDWHPIRLSDQVHHQPPSPLQHLSDSQLNNDASHGMLRIEQGPTLPDFAFYGDFLSSCRTREAVPCVRQVRSDLAFIGLELNTGLSESIVTAFAACGELKDALQAFHKLPYRTIVAWTAIISMCIRDGKGSTGMEIYQRMQEDGVEPSIYTFLSTLKACGSLEIGKELHAELRKKGFDSDAYIGSTLLRMYGNLGDILEAETIFARLPVRDVVSWNTMLATYLCHDQALKTLHLYRQMQEEKVTPSRRTFLITLRACRSLAQTGSNRGLFLEICQALQVDARRKGFGSDVFIGSMLISIHSKFSNITESESVFEELPGADAVLWNAMLSAYIEQGKGQRALQLYRQMAEEGVDTDGRSLVVALQACCTLAEQEEAVRVEGYLTKVMSLQLGRALHADAQRKGCDSDPFIRSILVSMYGKCGSIAEAENTLDCLHHGELVPQNAMLSAYVEQSQGEKALLFYRQMQEAGMEVNERTFVIVLQACCILAEKEEYAVVEGKCYKLVSMEIAQALHADAEKKGFGLDTFICSNLVNLYGKCGGILQAETTFFAMSKHNVETWNALLSAYLEQGEANRALQLYKHMDIVPNQWTFVIALQACCLVEEDEEAGDMEGQVWKPLSLNTVRALHAAARKMGFDTLAILVCALIHAYVACGSIVEAENVFWSCSRCEAVSWNAMLSAYIEDGQAEKALQLYRSMQGEGVSVNERTFVIAAQACCSIAEKEEVAIVHNRSCKELALSIGESLHIDAQKEAIDLNAFVGSTFVSMYSKCGSICDAESVFGRLSQPDTVSWTAMLLAYVEQGQGEKALHLYMQMQEEGATQDETTVNCMLQACNQTGSTDTCMDIHFAIVSGGCDQCLLLATTLIHAYGGCASMLDARAVFDSLNKPDLISWNALISGYSRGGNFLGSLQSFEEMLLTGVKPNGVTFLILLSVCNHAGLVDKGIEYFESMSRNYGISPKHEHVVSVVDLLGRAGDFLKIETLFLEMLVCTKAIVWSSLLRACQEHGNLQLGKQAFDYIEQIQPKLAPAAYVLMSNIYADLGLETQKSG